MEVEQEAVLTSMGEEHDAACRCLARNGGEKLQVFYFITLHLILCLSWLVWRNAVEPKVMASLVLFWPSNVQFTIV